MYMKKLTGYFAFIIFISSLPIFVYGAESNDNLIREKIRAQTEAVASDPKARIAAINEGRQHAIICAYCHGPDGSSSKTDIPNLSGQDPVYLLDQINRFIDGSRVDYTKVMQRLSRNFSEKEKVALVIYYASVPPKKVPGKTRPDKEGEGLYQARCQQCHGSDGRNKNGYAHIAGQQRGYVEKVLKDFRDKKKTRTNPVMSSMTNDLTDENIKSLSAYIKSMQ